VRKVILMAAMTMVLAAGSGLANAETTAKNEHLSLQECLKIARDKNHTRPASHFAVVLAEAQHRQALAGYWPQLSAKGGVEVMEHAPAFIFPASQYQIPSMTLTTPASTAQIVIPAGMLGNPTDMKLTVEVPSETITTPASAFNVPAQNVKLMDQRTESISGEAKWLLWDGGMRRGYADQAKAGVDVAKIAEKRTDLELNESVTRIYWGAVLAHQLATLGHDTLEQMETTLKITESLYKDGSGTVTKADYLDNKVMVETIRGMVATLEQNESTAQAALAYTMGLGWQDTVTPTDEEVPFEPSTVKLDELVGEAYQFNPDWKSLEAGISAIEGERKTAMSGYAPKFALTGSLHRYWNGYGKGLAISPNTQGWTIGAGVEIPIFDGFLTAGKVAEAQAKLRKMQEEKILLKEGLGLQLRTLFLRLDAAEKAYAAGKEARNAAEEDDDLTTRGYATGLLTTEKVVRAQLQKALVTASFYRAVYEHKSLEGEIDLAVGHQVSAALTAVH